MEKFLKKNPSKIDFTIGSIFGIGLFFLIEWDLMLKKMALCFIVDTFDSYI